MTEQEIHALGLAVAGYLVRFRPDLGDRANAAHLRDYARGLLSDLPRQSRHDRRTERQTERL